ncbi:UNVERIFIED_CONTAM: hypothetical protein NCL1_24179 [Trichonephila clavipes]
MVLKEMLMILEFYLIDIKKVEMRLNENYTFEGVADSCGQRPCVCPLRFLFTECPGSGSDILI